MLALAFREATASDLSTIVAMLADDALGKAREAPEPPLDPAYLSAFHAITASPHDHLVVAEEAGTVVGVFQLTLIPGLSSKGALRGQIETVRVASAVRGKGIGGAMIRHAIALCREHGCRSVQLTSDARRTDARRFYERLGFKASHVGFKLAL